MTTGIVVKPDPAAANAVDDAIAQASGAFHRGVLQVWLNQRFDVDALTLAAVISAAVPGLGVGTAVVPINPRHPLLVASAAQTAQAPPASGSSTTVPTWPRASPSPGTSASNATTSKTDGLSFLAFITAPSRSRAAASPRRFARSILFLPRRSSGVA